MACTSCGFTETEMKVCGSCFQVNYCSARCVKADLNNHKSLCQWYNMVTLFQVEQLKAHWLEMCEHKNISVGERYNIVWSFYLHVKQNTNVDVSVQIDQLEKLMQTFPFDIQETVLQTRQSILDAIVHQFPPRIEIN